MSARVLVRNSSGTVREVAASAVRVMAPGGWQKLTDTEVAAYQQEQAEEKAARRTALTAHSQRQAVASVPPPSRPRRSGGTDRAEGTTEQAVEATDHQKDED